MPNDLVLVRHGESEGNVANRAAQSGDLSPFTDEYMTTPGHRWSITATGMAQAATIGGWLLDEFVNPTGLPFDKHYVSPFKRTRQTAAFLGLVYDHTIDGHPTEPTSAQWMLNRALRERDWGDIGSIPRSEFDSRPEYALNARNRTNNPLYWTPPGGESLAHVAENRVRNVLDTLHREASGQRVIAVGHGETMNTFRLVLERLSDETFETLLADPDNDLPNCAVLHYSRSGPHPAATSTYLNWLRRASPVLTGTDPTDPKNWKVEVSDWQPVAFHTYTNNDLLF